MRGQPPDSPQDESHPPATNDAAPPADWAVLPDDAPVARMPVIIPVLPVRDVVVFPGTVTPLVFGRERSLRALRRARGEDALALLIAQRDPEEDDPGPEGLFSVGTVGRCLQALELPDGTVRAVFEGTTRVRITQIVQTDPFMKAAIEPVAEVRPEPAPWVEAIKRRALEDFEEATELSRRIPPEALITALNIDDLGQLADIVTSCLDLELGDRQELLEEPDCTRRLQTAARHLREELRVLRLEEEMRERVEDEIESSQREYYLREHLRAIQDELGGVDGVMGEAWEYRERIEAAELSEAALAAALEQVERLERMPMASPEVSVIRTYLDWLLELPWSVTTDDQLDIEKAAGTLDEDHYGLSKPKERILEFLAVRRLV